MHTEWMKHPYNPSHTLSLMWNHRVRFRLRYLFFG
jgi:hypothetical protein